MLVHGLWMGGAELALLSRRLNAWGYTSRRFVYASVADDLASNVAALDAFVGRHGLERPCFVCHSLGGLVVHAYLATRKHLPPTRVVALGTPFRGSGTARTLAGRRATRWLIGRAASAVLIHGVRAWPERHPLGVIAGNRPYGAGAIVHRFCGPHDGTVAVSETRIPGSTAHIVVPSTHTGLVFSRSVAENIHRFLRYECFEFPA